MSAPLGLFEAYGIELEYMIVDRDSLEVRPICDQVIQALAGEIVNEVSLGRINVSNELVLHVIEFKCNGPQKDLVRMRSAFQDQVRKVNRLLHERWNAQLLPTAMHPLMDPRFETRLWPHGHNAIYEAYNRIFDCRGHGWSNLQSIHINLPFRSDEEFGRLHAAVRIVLALLPGIAASSPLVEGRMTGKLDNRLAFYSQNQKKIASIIGSVIPEKVFSKSDYKKVIFDSIKRDISPHDPEGTLEEEWLNSRGAIARFERNAIEIRLLDIQESVVADFAVVSLVISLVKSLVDEMWLPYDFQKNADEHGLHTVFMRSIEEGGALLIEDSFILGCFQQSRPMSLQQLWSSILVRLLADDYPVRDFASEAEQLLQRGTLAHQLRDRMGPEPDRELIRSHYSELARCLDVGQIYA